MFAGGGKLEGDILVNSSSTSVANIPGKIYCNVIERTVKLKRFWRRNFRISESNWTLAYVHTIDSFWLDWGGK